MRIKASRPRHLFTKLACASMIVAPPIAASGCIFGGGGGGGGATKAVEGAVEIWAKNHGVATASVDIAKASSTTPTATVETSEGKKLVLEFFKEAGHEAPHANEYRVTGCRIYNSTSGICSGTEPEP